MNLQKYRKMMLSVWAIINIIIIICFVLDFLSVESYLLSEMYLKYLLIPLYLGFPLGTAAIFITMLIINFLFPDADDSTIDNIITFLIFYPIATIAFYFQWIYLFPKFIFKKKISNTKQNK